MDRYEVRFTLPRKDRHFLSDREDVYLLEVYAYNFGDALEKAINQFRVTYKNFSTVYKVNLQRFDEDYVSYD